MPRSKVDPVQRLLSDSAVRDLAATFDTVGRELYVVGGGVRDALLGVGGADDEVDFATDARPGEIERLIAPLASAVWTAGKRFGTIGARIGSRVVEITTYRSDVYVHESRKPDVTFGTSLEEDLRRRDFTINAMAIAPADGTLVDPFGGVQDLARKRLATPQRARRSFEEDPLRMLRAARFAGRFGLRPTHDVERAMKDVHDRLAIVSPERIRHEFDKIVVLEDLRRALWLLADAGVLAEFVPEIPALRVEQDPVHRHKDVLTHTVVVAERCSPRKLLRLAALFHDIGKPATRKIADAGVTFHHHDVVGAKMTRKRMRALRYPSAEIEAVSQLVFLHLRLHSYRMGWSDSAVRRYVRDAGPLLEDLNELIRCDCTTRNRAKAAQLGRRMDELEIRIAELAKQEELAKLRPALDGHEVMTRLGLSPGPAVGEALDFLMSIRLDEGEISKDEAQTRLAAWWEAKFADRQTPGAD